MANEIGTTLVNSLTRSSFDIGNMAKVLAEADVASQKAILAKRTEKVETEFSALKYLQTNLTAFQTYVSDLTSPALFRELSVSSSNESVVSAKAQSGAAAGVYQIESKQLAQTHSLVFAQTYASPQSTLASSGVFEFTVNGQTTSINLDASTGTLEGLSQYLNNGNFGVSAAVVNDGSGYRLMMNSKTSGAAGEITFGAANAAGFPNSNPASYTVTAVAQDAVLSLNGLDISNSTNRFSNVIEGVEFQLNSASLGAINTLTINPDSAKVEETIRSFVDVYNQLGTILSELGRYDASQLTQAEQESEEFAFYGDLAGSSLLRSVKDQIKTAMSGAIEGLGSGENALGFIGLNFDREGVLQIDEATFTNALQNNLAGIGNLLAKSGVSDNPAVRFLDATDRTETGNYTLQISQEATRAEWSFASQAGGTFDIAVDGSNMVTLNLPTDDSDPQAYLLSLVNTINNNSEIAATGATVSGYVNAANEIVLQSNRYGSESSLNLSLANTGDPLLQTGKNVDGTLQTASGGVLSLGVYADAEDGRKITISDFAVADNGDTQMRGLSFAVNGNPGANVNLNFAQGFASRLQETIDNFFTAETGLISQRLDSLTQKSDSYEEKSKQIDARYERLEMKYRLQFSVLQSIMSNAEATQNQLSALFNRDE
ncbi:MAG: flagellar filament capping protein FliD [Thiotrichales bacterium]|nr:flagellar filament capping protein FliD [Thiotrichales bacterium]